MRAFTLVEVMVVVALIGIFAALAVPNMTERIEAQKAEYEVLKVEDALTRFRNLSRVRVVCVEVQVVGNSLQATPYLDCDPLANPQAVETVAFNPKYVTLGAITGPGLVGNLTYKKDGGHGLAGPAQLALTLPTGGARTIKIFPATGYVRLVE